MEHYLIGKEPQVQHNLKLKCHDVLGKFHVSVFAAALKVYMDKKVKSIEYSVLSLQSEHLTKRQNGSLKFMMTNEE